MSTYTPDRWLIVKISDKEDNSHYRVFASWYGGYLGSDSWKLNSGITSATLEDGAYHFAGSSGSVYICYPGSYGASGYAHGVLDHLIKESETVGTTITVLPETTDPLKLNYN